MDAELKKGIILIHEGLMILLDQGMIANRHRERANELLAEQNRILGQVRPTSVRQGAWTGNGME